MTMVDQNAAQMSVAELFEVLPSRLDKDAAAGLTRTLEWNVTGEESGVWTFLLEDGAGRVVSGAADNPDVTFTIEDEVWRAIADGSLDPMRAFMTGQLAVEGDMMLATQVAELFPTDVQ